ncbi:MAG: hypothetical protein JJ879_11610 [Sneathiella sp.]|nr:hypothetical protein [Sneathiella sp.]
MNMNASLKESLHNEVRTEKLLEILDVVDAVARGEFENRIKDISKEDGLERQLCLKINEMIDRADAYVRESTACLRFIAENKYFRRISPEGLQGAYGYATYKINQAADNVEQKINRFSEVVESISAASEQLNSNAQSMGSVVDQANERTTAVASAAEEAGVNTNTVASAAEQLDASIQEINMQVSTSAGMSGDAVVQSREVNDMVEGLSIASDKIGQVVNLINDIAGQTKLLALNATIEAARAGDAGKGFAVVASEVKNLSGQTEKATDDIKSQVTEIQKAASEAVGSIKGIGGSIDQINEVASAIASAVEEQGAATREISRNVKEAALGVQGVTENVGVVSTAVNQVRESSKEVMSVAQELRSQAELLKDVLNQ